MPPRSLYRIKCALAELFILSVKPHNAIIQTTEFNYRKFTNSATHARSVYVCMYVCLSRSSTHACEDGGDVTHMYAV